MIADQRALAVWIAETDPWVARAPWLDAVERVLADLESHRGRYSDVLEWSAATSPDRTSHARFSYALPSHREDPRRAALALVRIADAMGVAATAERVARAARHPVVEQPLVGIAIDGPGSRRAKLYLQLRAHAGDAALGFASALLGVSRVPVGDLHLVGLDLDDEGAITGAKLYYRGGAVAPSSLRGLSESRLRDVLTIHRLVDRETSMTSATEIDFAVGGSSVDREALGVAVPELRSLAPLEARFIVRARRASLAPGGRATVYYVVEGERG